jgi:hypothetical protein
MMRGNADTWLLPFSPTPSSHPCGSQDRREHPLTTAIHRILNMTANAFSESKTTTNQRPIEQIRESLRTLLHDCKDMHTQRVIYKINVAQTASELWQLRSDLHQCITKAHSQTEAAERINSVIAVFEGWMPAGQLKPI